MSKTHRNPPDKMSYLLHGVDRKLWDLAKKKADSHRPRLSMKWVIIQMLEKWVGPEGKPKAAGPPKPEPLPESPARRGVNRRIYAPDPPAMRQEMEPSTPIVDEPDPTAYF